MIYLVQSRVRIWPPTAFDGWCKFRDRFAIASEADTLVAERVTAIATARRDQSNALDGVNASFNQKDQMTQRNAAMVEETNTASRELADEAYALIEIVNQF